VGVIQVVHKDPGRTGRHASLSAGSHGSGSGSVAFPFSWSGFQSSLAVDGGRTGFKDDRTGFDRGHVLWRNARALGSGRLRFDLDGGVTNQDPASPTPREGRTLSPRVPLDSNHNPAGAFLDDRRVTLSAGYDRPAAHALWSTAASFSKGRSEILRGFLSTLDAPLATARGIRENIDQTDLYFDTHLQWTSSSRYKLVAGLDHLHGEGQAEGADFDYLARLDGSSEPRADEPALLDVHIEDRREFSGLYGFAEWIPSATLRFEGGLRLNRTMEEREGEEEAARPAGEEEAGEITHVRLSGSAGITWTAWERGDDRVRLFAAYRNTYKPAAIDFGIEEGEGEEGEGILDPETAQSYEVGLRLRGLGRHAELELSAFLMDFDNLVMATSVRGVPALINGGTQRFKGFESGLSWRPRPGWSARASYSFHDSRFRDFVQDFDGVPTQLGGKRLEMTARHLLAAGVHRAPERGILAGLELNRVGSRFLNKRNTALADGYSVVSASLGWRQPRWEVRADGRNLGDARDPVAESELGDAQYYRLPAFRLDVSARLRF
jgi:iron complex outermembrane receptor protein